MDKIIENMIPVIAIIFTFGIPGILIFWAIQSKHRERMRLIEKGLSAEEMKAYFSETSKRVTSPYRTLKWGIIFGFLGVGFLVAKILENVYDLEDDVTVAVLLIAGGAGFLLYYFIVRNKVNGNSNTSIVRDSAPKQN
jgi:hypothetical protein